MTTSTPEQVDLVLDEMFSPKIAEALREYRRIVIAVAERTDLRAMTDDDLYAWAAAQKCWLSILPSITEQPWSPDRGHRGLARERPTGAPANGRLASQHRERRQRITCNLARSSYKAALWYSILNSA